MISEIRYSQEELYQFWVFNGFSEIIFRVKEKYLRDKWIA